MKKVLVVLCLAISFTSAFASDDSKCAETVDTKIKNVQQKKIDAANEANNTSVEEKKADGTTF